MQNDLKTRNTKRINPSPMYANGLGRFAEMAMCVCTRLVNQSISAMNSAKRHSSVDGARVAIMAEKLSCCANFFQVVCIVLLKWLAFWILSWSPVQYIMVPISMLLSKVNWSMQILKTFSWNMPTLDGSMTKKIEKMVKHKKIGKIFSKKLLKIKNIISINDFDDKRVRIVTCLLLETSRQAYNEKFPGSIKSGLVSGSYASGANEKPELTRNNATDPNAMIWVRQADMFEVYSLKTVSSVSISAPSCPCNPLRLLLWALDVYYCCLAYRTSRRGKPRTKSFIREGMMYVLGIIQFWFSYMSAHQLILGYIVYCLEYIMRCW